ncbi:MULTISPECIES: hypothetical protein [Lysinibacillus]|uniref:Uncharacterized protein n=1 Tax=Lysinibacillus boronitolerans JCM 21713 = 10a = NBRC 103108 TaxID=1294264 RepID=A0ABR4Y450_9BACI|nr:hypothetical protein [Lysinibacillus boronitolerans]KGR88830.1 hypothetical protein CD31_02255 [Lysinibacillus boronitolerans JCM 21713 = 10a = NBRC 103108]
MQAKKIISGVLLGLSVTLSGALISSAEEIENNETNNVSTENNSEISQNSGEITPYAVHERWVSGIRKPYSLFSTVEKQVFHINGDWSGVLNLVAIEDSYDIFTGKRIKVGVYEGWLYPR